MANLDKTSAWKVIGLVPAAGQATRIHPLPCSKELYPIGFRPVGAGLGLRPKVVCHYLLEKMRLAGVTKAYIVLRKGKWDIPAYLGDGTILNMHLTYLVLGLPYGVPYTLDQAYPFLDDALVAFGFPDIIFQPDDGFQKLLERQAATNADIVLGVFPVDRPQAMDMVDIDDAGRVHPIVIKPAETNLRYAWIFTVWAPAFTSFMHDFLRTPDSSRKKEIGMDRTNVEELSVGHVIQAAINERLRAEAVVFQNHVWLDVGTPDGLLKAVRQHTPD